MGVRIPRITLKADYGDESSFGELSLLSIGYGLHQAWVYATMFATSSIFGVHTSVTGMYGSNVSLTFLVSIVVFGVCLLFAAATSQRLGKLYASKKTLVTGAALTSLGTAMLLIPALPAEISFAVEIVAGILTGVGSAVLILFWGTAFARCDSTSIVLNSAIAIAVAIGVYAFCLQAPFALSGVLIAIIPLLELIVLWKKTPEPFSTFAAVPVFNPLPVSHAKFFLKFGVPVFAFGVALGMLRQTSLQFIMPAATALDQIVLLLAAGCATVLILITILALGGAGRWNRYFRPLVPFIAVAIFFLPFSEMGNLTFSGFFLLIGYMCFEALMWIFFGELSQRFRLLPAFVFGLGRGLLALSALLGSLYPVIAAQWISYLPFGEDGAIIIILLIMVIAYALLPGEREIEAIIIPCPLVKNLSGSLDLERRAASLLMEQTDKTGTNANSSNQVEPTVNTTTAQHDDTAPSLTINQSNIAQSSSLTSEKDISRGWFRTSVETVANTYLLSQRETEVLFLLAKGNNSAAIQQKLYISEGTAKTHIRHIYKKLDVHTQQELMRLVEQSQDLG